MADAAVPLLPARAEGGGGDGRQPAHAAEARLAAVGGEADRAARARGGRGGAEGDRPRFRAPAGEDGVKDAPGVALIRVDNRLVDRKSTRLNSSHGYISYAVFCLKKKKKN